MKSSSKSKSFGAYTPQGRIAHFKGSEQAIPLLNFLMRELPSQHQPHLQFLIDLGAVYLNKKRVRDPQVLVEIGDLVRVHLEPKRYALDPESLHESLVFENDQFLIFNKPTGIPMHATLDNAKENLAESYGALKGRKLFVTHRLDVPTSGLVLLAKTKEFQATFNDVISKREVQKTYQALTIKQAPVGLHKHYMVVSDRAPKKLLNETEFLALINYEPMDECLLEILSCSPVQFDLKHTAKISAPGFESRIKLITGRTHQIRAQLSSLGASIVGDEMYGGMPAPFFGLHACELSFKDPNTGKDFHFEAFRSWS